MEKSTFEQIGGTYRREGDYFRPNLTVPESVPVGIWASVGSGICGSIKDRSTPLCYSAESWTPMLLKLTSRPKKCFYD